MLSRRDVSPTMVKGVRWFSRILWFGLIAGLVAAINYGNTQKERAEELRKQRDELLQENDRLRAAARAEKSPKETKKPDGGTLP
ncbi:MAG: hypothetical protein KDB07_06720 [Planctomycetes bacterium]|nr:hypothetical protein [Planctomycetota bacterium]